MYYVTKTYGHDLGLSACFRQWRAESHCRLLHGYALSFTLKFAAHTLDDRNWVIDFGALKAVKQHLCDTFDHKLVVAEDDPQLDMLASLAGLDLADVLVLPRVGCEYFAEHVYDWVTDWLSETDQAPRVFLHSVECREHAGNSATKSNPYLEPVNAR